MEEETTVETIFPTQKKLCFSGLLVCTRLTMSSSRGGLSRTGEHGGGAKRRTTRLSAKHQSPAWSRVSIEQTLIQHEPESLKSDSGRPFTLGLEIRTRPLSPGGARCGLWLRRDAGLLVAPRQPEQRPGFQTPKTKGGGVEDGVSSPWIRTAHGSKSGSSPVRAGVTAQQPALRRCLARHTTRQTRLGPTWPHFVS